VSDGEPDPRNQPRDELAALRTSFAKGRIAMAREERVRPRPTMMNAIFPVFRIRPQI
jgi:hypothetical protein